MRKNLLWISLIVCPFFLYGIKKGKERTYKEGILHDEFIYEKAPFQSCHAGTIVENSDGILIASWFGGTYEGEEDVCIYVSRKVDGHWTAPKIVADGIKNDSLRYPTWNPVLYQVPNRDLQLYYKVGQNPRTWEGMMITSEDGGVTWSKEEKLPDGILGPIKNKPVLIGNKLISPSSTEDDGWKIHFEISEDFGKTWRKTASINDGYNTIAIQPCILNYTDGRIHALCRSKNRAVLQTWSSDFGENWSALTQTSLPQNNSGIDAITLSDGRQLVVYNHVLPPDGKTSGSRSPLNIAVSNDGQNWKAALILEDETNQRFSYPAVIQTNDGLVHVIYTWKRIKMKYVIIDPSMLELSPIIDGLWPE
ncbi:sialidase family protein [Sunxiuqinia sp. A32]|uniref:sialidase family protein n=1 Tax=Sunxiuqinia sp. A32 TaxID=3461496 RepID=UPI0040454C6F